MDEVSFYETLKMEVVVDRYVYFYHLIQNKLLVQEFPRISLADKIDTLHNRKMAHTENLMNVCCITHHDYLSYRVPRSSTE